MAFGRSCLLANTRRTASRSSSSSSCDRRVRGRERERGTERGRGRERETGRRRMRVYSYKVIHIHVHAHGSNTLADNERTLTKQTYHLIELILSFIDSFPIVTVHHKYQSLQPTSGACECVY